ARITRALHLGLSSVRLKRVPVMATAFAYYDESESPTTCVVAGLGATVDRWKLFNADWKSLLKQYGITALHMKHYAHFKGEFESWRHDLAKRDKFMRDAIRIISRRCMVATGIVIDRDMYHRTIGQDPFIRSFYSNEYTTAAFMSILLVDKWASG